MQHSTSLPLSTLASTDRIENVVIFISDSLRIDHLKDEVKEKGVWGNGVSPSTLTASSIPSLFTGKRPSSHGIWNFQQQLNTKPTLFNAFEEVGYKTRNMFNWPRESLHLSEAPNSMAELHPPFIYIFHDKGDHLPYNQEYENSGLDSLEEFFDEKTDQELRELYDKSIDKSNSYFEQIINQLKSRDLLNETLVIYLSDHGELLGEYGGAWGHGAPMTPELIEVPFVFAGADLPKNKRVDRLLWGLDIAPTIFSARGVNSSEPNEGCDLWTEIPERSRVLTADTMSSVPKLEKIARYRATAACDENGMYVFNRESKISRVLYLLIRDYIVGDQARSYSPNSVYRLLRTYSDSVQEKGEPQISRTKAREIVESLTEQDGLQSETDITPNKEKLKQLGYLE